MSKDQGSQQLSGTQTGVNNNAQLAQTGAAQSKKAKTVDELAEGIDPIDQIQAGASNDLSTEASSSQDNSLLKGEGKSRSGKGKGIVE